MVQIKVRDYKSGVSKLIRITYLTNVMYEKYDEEIKVPLQMTKSKKINFMLRSPKITKL